MSRIGTWEPRKCSFKGFLDFISWDVLSLSDVGDSDDFDVKGGSARCH